MIKAKKKSGLRSVAGSGLWKMGAGRDLKASAERLAVGCCTLFILSTGYPSPSPASGDSSPTALVKVNRTVPQVEPPKTVLEFSANPTVQELFRARIFEEPLAPAGGEPGASENATLAAALLGYSKRSNPDDFSSLTGFLETHPQSPWRAALLTNLGIEYYNAARYSLALESWSNAWLLAKDSANAGGKFLADRAVCELASLYARLGRMKELEALLKSVEQRLFLGGATERINIAREALSMMQDRPGTSFRCGPLALQRILLSNQRLLTSSPTNAMMEIFNSASTQQGCSLPQVAELSVKLGLNYQMAFRERGGAFVIPSVVHWKVGHYAALVRLEGERYLLEDPTFRNTVWATKQALEAETSGYFLIPPGDLPRGWRSVNAKEGAAVWGKGTTGSNDSDRYTHGDLVAGQCVGAAPATTPMGMAVSRVHLMLVNLQINDTPVGYTPPVGPPVRFTVRYNHRDYVQQSIQTTSLFGPKWTHDWFNYIKDNPGSPLADVKHFVGGGGARTHTGFNTNTQAFAHQQYDQTLLRRTGANGYEMTFPDGSKKIFGLRDLSSVYLTQVVDAAGNAVTLTWDGSFFPFHLVALTDAIGQVTTISYEHPSATDLITKVTDPFGRFAAFDYEFHDIRLDPNKTNLTRIYRLASITDVLGLVSQFGYLAPTNMTIQRLSTPYGTTTFTSSEASGLNGTTRFLETVYPDGSRDRVEFNQTITAIGDSDPTSTLPTGMAFNNVFLRARNTYYWSRNACATAYGDYTKARFYHWLHAEDINSASGILESTKEPLENRVWYNYPGQSSALLVGNNNRPSHVGRVLDDGSTQLATYGYNGFGHLTNSIDPVGRELSYLYATNGIDLLEVRQTRGTNNELLSLATYNNQHRPLTLTDAAGQTTTFTYNSRGQPLTETNPKGETSAYTYDTNAYIIMVDGPLPGTSDVRSATYDAFGRTRTLTDESGYTLTFNHDALDRLTKITYPDATFSQYTFNRLDPVVIQDRAGRQTLLEYNPMRQVTKRTDPLNRVMLLQWCSCGSLSSLTDPMGRTTTWNRDLQGRLTSKQYGDGSQVRYTYENTIGRVRQVVDEKLQGTAFTYNRDNTLKSIAYANATVPTPSVNYTYDPKYQRPATMTDGTGSTLYSYNPSTGTPALGAGRLAVVDGPLLNDTITYAYDELGRRASTAINGVASVMTYDAAGRVVSQTNASGVFTSIYDGATYRMVTNIFPNGQTVERGYANNLGDQALQRITHKVGATPVSEFIYGRDIAADRIIAWSQQSAAQSPLLHSFAYDTANQLLSATVTNSGTLVNTFAYTYDPAGNRLTEQVGASSYTATYNALNQINTSTQSGVSRTNEWDAKDRLVAVNSGNQRTEFTYDGRSRLASIRRLTNGVEASLRRFLWCDGRICEERNAAGVVTKRFFPQGMKVESGPVTGMFYYTRDHLGSIRELTDSGGNVRARYAYDPFGRRTRLTGDVEADFGFAGMFWSAEASLSLTHFRAYDPELGRWLSRDPLRNAEVSAGPNLYAYVVNDPVNRIDPEGLCAGTPCLCGREPGLCATIIGVGAVGGGAVVYEIEEAAPVLESVVVAAEDAAGALENALVCRGGELQGMLNYVNPFANTTPAIVNIAASVPRVAEVALSLKDRTILSLDWLFEAMYETRFYRDYLDATDQSEAKREFIAKLGEWSKALFGL